MTDMNMNGFATLVIVAGFLLLATAMILLMARRSGRELERAWKSAAGETSEIRDALAALRNEVAEMKHAAPQAERGPQPFVPSPALSAEQRAEALSMLRSGIGGDTVRATLRLPWAEATLLQKVETLLASASAHK
jgi:hypothetical protein